MTDLPLILSLVCLVTLVGGLNVWYYFHRRRMTDAERAEEDQDIEDEMGIW